MYGTDEEQWQNEEMDRAQAAWARELDEAAAITPAACTYECLGCGEAFMFRHLADIEWDGQPCPNRCGDVLSHA